MIFLCDVKMSLLEEIRKEISTPISIEEAVKFCGPGNWKGILYDDLEGWTEKQLAKYDGIIVLFTMHGR